MALDSLREHVQSDQHPYQSARSPRRRRLGWLLGLLILGALAGAAYVYYKPGHQAPVQYQSARVERGRIATTVNAVGTLNPVVSVQVGSQISGTIQKLLVDFNTLVTAGQVIAQIDPAPFEARVSQARANVASARSAVQVAQATVENTQAAIDTARANVANAQANIDKAQIAVADARLNLERQTALMHRALIAQRDLDAARVAFDSAVSQHKATLAQYDATQGQLRSAQAQTRLAQAQYTAAQAQVEQAQAALQVSELDLSHTTIRSPVTGIVIARNIDVGQTVAASLQAPTLFLIAKDLTHMQIDTNVNEGDIGQLHEGQSTTFIVDAYPDKTFTGQVVQVRHAPITVQNVVTYDAVVAVDNPDLALKPGMTANVTFVVAERQGVLKVPNAALRFQASDTPEEVGASASRGPDWGKALQARLTQALALTPEQQTRLQAILDRSQQQRRQWREQGLSEEERRQQGQALRRNTRAQIRALLTEAQSATYDELVKTFDQRQSSRPNAGRAGRVWVLRADGTPEAVALRLGMTDETTTEVLAGALQEGQAVITGVAAAAKREQTTPPGFGARPRRF